MKLSVIEPCRQLTFYPEFKCLYAGFGSLPHRQRETGCEEDKELITNTHNCFDVLHSKGNGFGETWSGSCTTNFSASMELVSFVISLHAVVLLFL